ncbi:MAG: hypothetical protein IKV41_02910 [Oscillospiraceae bacterium]|nr:hypothetical protein [Oscillospiraceae bacterium]
MSYFIGKKEKSSLPKQVLFAAALLCVFMAAVDYIDSTAKQEQLNAARQAVYRAAVQCYASEGFYPPTTEYLEEKYGLMLDEESYIVDYQCFASNIMPEITVLPKE